MKTLKEDEVRRLFESTAEDRLHALWVLLTTTGLRLGKAVGLQWQDIDFDNRRFVVQRALQRQVGVGLVFVEPKIRTSRRTLTLPEGTARALQLHWECQTAERLINDVDWKDQGLVFCRWDGSPIEPSGVVQRFHRLLKNAGLPDIRVHDLRHTAATLYLKKGPTPRSSRRCWGTARSP